MQLNCCDAGEWRHLTDTNAAGYFEREGIPHLLGGVVGHLTPDHTLVNKF